MATSRRDSMEGLTRVWKREEKEGREEKAPMMVHRVLALLI